MPRKPKPPAFLQKFCYLMHPDWESMRYSGIVKPWAVDGWWYATDKTIMVAFRLARLKAQEPVGRVPSTEICENCLPDPDKGRWHKWPTDPETKPCPECGGEGGGCPGCEGTGIGLYKMDHVWVARHYFDLIKALPKVEYKYRKPAPGSREPLQFRYDNGVGAVMPVGEEDD